MGKKHKRINRDTDAHSAETIRLREEGKLLLLTRKEIVTGILDTAIYAWLGNADPVAIHMLACIAHQNLHRMATKTDKAVPILNQGSEWEDIYSFYNDVKHATGDPNHRDQFVVENNQIMLFDCVQTYGNTFSFRTPWMNTFASYVGIHHSIPTSDPRDEFFPGIRVGDVIDLSREAFVKKMYPIFVDCYKRGFH